MVFVARLKIARLKITIFHDRAGGATESGASKTNYFPRGYLWRD
jgi:hypothetical protein